MYVEGLCLASLLEVEVLFCEKAIWVSTYKGILLVVCQE